MSEKREKKIEKTKDNEKQGEEGNKEIKGEKRMAYGVNELSGKMVRLENALNKLSAGSVVLLVHLFSSDGNLQKVFSC